MIWFTISLFVVSFVITHLLAPKPPKPMDIDLTGVFKPDYSDLLSIPKVKRKRKPINWTRVIRTVMNDRGVWVSILIVTILWKWPF